MSSTTLSLRPQDVKKRAESLRLDSTYLKKAASSLRTNAEAAASRVSQEEYGVRSALLDLAAETTALVGATASSLYTTAEAAMKAVAVTVAMDSLIGHHGSSLGSSLVSGFKSIGSAALAPVRLTATAVSRADDALSASVSTVAGAPSWLYRSTVSLAESTADFAISNRLGLLETTNRLATNTVEGVVDTTGAVLRGGVGLASDTANLAGDVISLPFQAAGFTLGLVHSGTGDRVKGIGDNIDGLITGVSESAHTFVDNTTDKVSKVTEIGASASRWVADKATAGLTWAGDHLTDLGSYVLTHPSDSIQWAANSPSMAYDAAKTGLNKVRWAWNHREIIKVVR